MSGTKSPPPKKAAATRQGGKKTGGGGPPQAVPRKQAAEAGSGVANPVAAPKEMPRMQKRYLEEVRGKLQSEFGYKNPMQVPKLEKIVINMGVGEATADQKKLDNAVAELTAISGQRAVKTLSKKAIAGFKIRKGLPIGTKVTLRKARMYEFMDRLITIALPRV